MFSFESPLYGLMPYISSLEEISGIPEAHLASPRLCRRCSGGAALVLLGVDHCVQWLWWHVRRLCDETG